MKTSISPESDINPSGAPVADSSNGDVSGTYRAGILGSRPWIRMYVARHQKEQELGTVRSST